MECEKESAEISRPLADYHPDVWGDQFLTYCPPDEVIQRKMEQEAEQLKEIVRKEILVVDKDPKERLVFLDSIHRLGVAYHFENEIEDTYQKFHKKMYDDSSFEDDLYYVSLRFRLLRQHGFNVSCDVFDKFKSEDGSYKACTASEVHGILSLYEASYLRVHGEDKLDEALTFATTQLKSFATQLSSPMAEQVSRSLKQPLHRRTLRLESRYQISIYEPKSSHEESLLRFAKVDFNILQILYNTELQEVTRWWRRLDLTKKLPFVRDRVVEACFWILGAYCEPRYSLARILNAKLFKIISVINDIYDSYGTVDELQLFTEAFLRFSNMNRGERSYVDQLPNYMKVAYQATQDTLDEIGKDLTPEQQIYAIHSAKKHLAETCQAYLEEAKWREQKLVPTYDEYMKNGVFSSGYLYVAVSSFLGMGEFATKGAFEWANQYPKAIKDSCIIGRLINDISSHEFEVKRGHIVTALNSHMGQFGKSMEETIKELRSEVECAWKDLNEVILRPTIVSRPLLTCVINLTRILYDVYPDEKDGYTMTQFIREQVEMILIEPIIIE